MAEPERVQDALADLARLVLESHQAEYRELSDNRH